MTVSSTTAKDTYAGDGSTTTFSFTFPILDETHITFEFVNDTTDVVTSKTLTTDYTVSGTGNDTGSTNFTSGTITMVTTTAASGETVVIRRGVPIKQSTDYTENDAFPAETHEDALDKLTMIAQQIDEVSDRTIRMPSSATSTNVTVPDPAGEGEKYVKVNSAGTAFEYITLSSTAGLGNIVEDISPQLGADLDTNTFDIQFDDATGIRDDSDNEQLIFQKTTTAVNYFEITNAATAGDVKLSSAGSDTNVTLEIESKGSGNIKLDPGSTGDVSIEGASLLIPTTEGIRDGGGDEFLVFTESTTPVNYLSLNNTDTGTGPTVASAGDDTNVDLTIDTKGTGTLTLGSADTTSVVMGTTVTVPDEIQHTGDTNNKVGFTTDTQTYTTGGSTRMDITDSGVQLGGSGARVTTVLDEDTLSSNSDTALATQQSIKAYADSITPGGLVHLLTATASTSSSLDFTSAIDTTYEHYIFVIESLLPATDNDNLYIRTSTDGGSTFDTGASDYAWGLHSSVADAADTADDEIEVITNAGAGASSVTAEGGINGTIRMYIPSSATQYTGFTGHVSYWRSDDSAMISSNFAAQRRSAADVDGVRFLFVGGNIATGTIRMYGVVKS